MIRGRFVNRLSFKRPQMKTAEKVHLYSQLVQLIDYDHKEGGKYAYVQFLSYTRELLLLLRPIGDYEQVCETIEAINQQFNDDLCGRFGEKQREQFHSNRTQLQLLIWSVYPHIENSTNGPITIFKKAG
jgi:hypothetical protein